MLLFFEQPHSAGCRWMWGTLNGVLLKHPGLKVQRVCIQDQVELAKAHRVTSVPHLAVVCEGELIDFRRGVYTPSYLHSWLVDTLEKAR